MRITDRACALALAVCLAAATPALAGEFSATVTQSLDGRVVMTGKTFVKGAKTRTESSVNGRRQVIVTDPGTGRLLMIQPSALMYMEGRLDPGQANADGMEERPPEDGAWTAVGRESVEGLECEKRVFAFRDASRGELTVWFSPQLGRPVRSVWKQGGQTMTSQYTAIRLEPQPDTLFAPPTGYQRVPMPPAGQPIGPEALPGRKPQ